MKCAQVLWLFFAIAHAAVIQQRALPHYPGIQFSSDRKLSITVFSDLHFGEPSYVRNRQYADLNTIGVMSFVLDNERSDFVVLNGDLVSCEWVAPADANKLIDQIMAPLVDRNLPFGATFGNHDASKTCSTLSMSEHMWWDVKGKNGRKLSFTTQSVVGEVDKVGWSNYFVPVYSSTNGGDLKMLLWFFDSKGGRKYQPTGEDVGVPSWVDERVVEWFRRTNAAFRQQHGRVIPSLAFVHIPVFATRAFQEKDHTRTANPGINEERIGYQGDVCDSQGNNCKYSGADIPFMKALVETEGLMAVFSGHDHGVDWCMKWSKNLPNTTPSNGNGLKICFNRHSGYGGYSDWTRGARQIVVGEDMLGKNIVDTWIRLENGKVSGKVTLNNTFGTDQYSATDLSKTSAP
ncbi:Metallo-dependent phosphatase-like protein [Bipolaris maydis]|nr:Metallo-dependent phosphatase-like protein [Bipolaris maydis]KAJ5020825.1 Metallo-dependent phosphatase-like protein [Bipolaris maydis]KAJ5020893.1 Metallo-dependent phosphatase-like protein [Bipolaris maydis]KAJ5021124.1 Metallo-dependent phosphatase-like protein [Bipolaris maydis]KAJ5021754.1 Metallo-dependent phosphatase-like protein [Bipolaris maydis]